MNSIDYTKVLHQLVYDPNNPLLFNSGFFVYFFIIFIIFHYLLRKKYMARATLLSAFSLYFFYKASGSFVILVVVSAVIDYILSIWIYQQRNKVYKKTLLVVCIVLNLAVLFYFKYTNFFIDIINHFSFTKLDPIHILLPIGISFYTFENISYAVDVYKNEIKPEKNIIHYLLFLSFFPKLVMGPIVRAKDFIPQLKKEYYVSTEDFSRGFFLIVSGLFKKLIISDYITLNLVDYVFDGPQLHNGLECLVAIYGYAIVIYCDFSGYSDVAIGISKWLGITIPANFKSPYQSVALNEFWRRWHISLSSWLRDYLYIPLGGNKNGVIRTNINLFLTMLIGGFWHGASWNFIIWGALHGVGLIINKIWNILFKKYILLPKIITNTIYGLLTFHFVCFCWIFFKAQNLEIANTFISQIAYNFTFEGYQIFINNYKFPLLMIVLGYTLHLMPESWSEKYIKLQTKLPLVYHITIVLCFIALYSYFKSSESVLPIYLQF
ncbi:MBOAT family O-acyltransferase [Flavobacterium psychrophilum]|uniref:MBOAT family O-acyltransferase n=1 Tax=Flavobacterium psychrophilum TaxID=96345 RepID=UPI001D089FF6|nr:MBOAT family O-acyltransferase [Flavobacterium psychrophilum]MCB5995842.1 MBOAT family protein [Flavobacterium psychrophilum]MCB6003313.1 MBOAT family protein [Flavobacterium psychrophilum]MCB6040439.1 MBOAT family protein [Flavobacterium psychrophilum]MCB6072690.1 MBOAT family protein [Flavobacterium psychrophilum]MCB6074910.1 MBOAT family protein [Flavobacterium psychrophilum]